MTDNADDTHRYRISSKFILPKIFICIGLFVFTYSWSTDIYNQIFGEKSIAHLFGTGFLGVILYYLSKVKIVDYDSIKCIIYVFDPKGKFESEIPVERITRILFSAVGLGRGSHSYNIFYHDSDGQEKKVRLFPIYGNNDIDTIISDTKLRNPEVVTRTWSFGVNEFLD
jgi:hypothetical protein